MKKVLLLLALMTVCTLMQGVNYCSPASWGNAGTNVTGGGNATPTVVRNESELKNALKNSNQVIVISQNITVSNQISTDKSNLTLTALPGVRLISTQQSQSVSGILYLKGSNIILRNLIFEGPGAYDCDGKDNLTLDGAKNVWVDHCDFQDGCDGNFDIKGKSDNITVSWCRFRYLKAPKAGGSGGADDHRFSNLVGSSSTDKPADGTYNITYGFCWWDEGCKQRMTRCRNCELHFLNCYWNSSVADYYVGPENAVCYFEGCTFAGKANSAKNIFKAFNNTSNSCLFVNCTGNLPSNSGSVSAPSYGYDALTAATAKNFVTNACGAGATLTTDEQGHASSSCDDEENPGEKPGGEGPSVSGDCCVDLSLGEEPTTMNGGIPAGFPELSLIVNLAKGKWDQGFLNMGGNADYITFDFSAYQTVIESVEFDVTIPNWDVTKNTISYHWNNNANTSYAISGNTTETVRLQAPSDARSFTIQRSAGTSTRISSVCFQLAATGEEAGVSYQQSGVSNRKMLKDGQLYILSNGLTYTIYGQQIY